MTNDITTAIQKAIEDTVPMVVMCARSIPGFTDKCKEAIDEVKWAQRRWGSRPTESNLHELQHAKHTRASVISLATEMYTEEEYHRLQMGPTGTCNLTTGEREISRVLINAYTSLAATGKASSFTFDWPTYNVS